MTSERDKIITRVGELYPGYSNRVRSRFVDAFNKTRLVFTGNNGDDSTVGLTGQDFFRAGLQGTDFLAGRSPMEVGFFNGALPKVTETLLLATDPPIHKSSYIREVGQKDFGNFFPVAIALSLDDEVAIRVVHGATTEMPLRSLTSMIPALVIMESLAKAGVKVPQLQMISAHHISADLNDIDFNAARKEAEKFAISGRRFLQDLFPQVEGNVTFLEDRPISETGDVLGELVESLDSNIPTDVKEQLMQKGLANGGGSNHMHYASAHVLVHDLRIPDLMRPLNSDQPRPVDYSHLINIGNVQERFFYNLRKALMNAGIGDYPTVTGIQYITRHSTPPYYMDLKGDVRLDREIDLDDLSQNLGIGPLAMRDYEYLRDASNRRRVVNAA